MIIMNFKMTSSCCTIVDRKDHVHYLQFQRAIPDDYTCSMTEQNMAINDHNNAMIRDLYHVYLNKCEFHFLRLHVNKIYNIV